MDSRPGVLAQPCTPARSQILVSQLHSVPKGKGRPFVTNGGGGGLRGSAMAGRP